MDDETADLATVAGKLAQAAGDQDELAQRALQVAEHLSRGRFHVSVLGEFKRGKSTLVNALIGRELAPMGVVPLTAVATEISDGAPGASVVGLDGERREIPPADVADYVTETGNPGNRLGVARVEARAPIELLRPGVVLVDTPGLGSVLRHDDEAMRALLDADGAILVLSADAPLSQQERTLLARLAERRAPTFVVLNRADHLSEDERCEVGTFVANTVAEELGGGQRVWCVSARAALDGRLGRATSNGQDGLEFDAFLETFRRFIAEDLVHARAETARAELSRLAAGLDGALAIEAATADLDTATLARRAEELRAAAEEQGRAFEDERTLLQRDVAALATRIGEDLATFATREPRRYDPELAEIARRARLGQLEDELRGAIERAVRGSFDRFRQTEAADVEATWSTLAQQFRDRTQARVNAVRSAAADIFQIELPNLTVPSVTEERERYFYLFLHVGSSTESIDILARRLLPPNVLRRRLLARARRELRDEFDKHAGRVRWDLTQRLDGARRRFEAAMAGELDRSVQTILAATSRAEELRSAVEIERRQRQAVRDAARRVTQEVLALTGG